MSLRSSSRSLPALNVSITPMTSSEWRSVNRCRSGAMAQIVSGQPGDHFGHEVARLGGVEAHLHARVAQRLHLRLGRALGAGDDGAGVAHLLAGRRGDTGDVGD